MGAAETGHGHRVTAREGGEMEEAELLKAAENIYDGWYADAPRVDWTDFLDRLESHTDVDLGSQMDSPLIRRIKRHINAYAKL
jgi:hypothetical protein